MIAAVIFTTVLLQDTYDQVCDPKRGPKTVTLMIGDRTSRWTVAIPVVFRDNICPCFWNAAVVVIASSLLLAGTVGTLQSGPQDD